MRKHAFCTPASPKRWKVSAKAGQMVSGKVPVFAGSLPFTIYHLPFTIRPSFFSGLSRLFRPERPANEPPPLQAPPALEHDPDRLRVDPVLLDQDPRRQRLLGIV